MANVLLQYCPRILRTSLATSQLSTKEIGKFNVIATSNQWSSFPLTPRLYSTGRPISTVDYAVVKAMATDSQKFLIDVREPKELKETGQIPFSINIPLGSVNQELSSSEKLFKSKYARDKPKLDSELVFHCKSGIRSLKAAEAAVALGFTNVKNYEGSWMDWAEHEGLPK